MYRKPGTGTAAVAATAAAAPVRTTLPLTAAGKPDWKAARVAKKAAKEAAKVAATATVAPSGTAGAVLGQEQAIAELMQGSGGTLDFGDSLGVALQSANAHSFRS